MLVRDLFKAQRIKPLYDSLLKEQREVAVFLIDHHPGVTQWITSDLVIGVGWDDCPPYGEDCTLRWLGDGFSPSNYGSALLHLDPEVGWVRLSNKLASAAMKLQKETNLQTLIYPQEHIKTRADAAKLFRYMNKYLLAA